MDGTEALNVENGNTITLLKSQSVVRINKFPFCLKSKNKLDKKHSKQIYTAPKINFENCSQLSYVY